MGGWLGVVGLADNKAHSAPIELELELRLSLAIVSIVDIEYGKLGVGGS